MLYYKENTFYDPFQDQTWELSQEGTIFFKNFIQGRKKNLNETEIFFVDDLKKEGLILNSSKSATWFLTLKCSLNCEHCYQNLVKEEEVLSWDKTRLILQRLLDWQVNHISLSGGDIFLNNHLFPLLHEIEEKSPQTTVSLLTNGFILAQNKKFQENLRQFKKWKPFIQLSLYSYREKIHDQITNIKESFEKTIQTIKFLQRNDFSFLINVVLMKSNFDDRNGLINFLENDLKIPRDNFNFDTLLFPYVGQSTKEVEKYSLSVNKLQQLLHEEEFRALPVKYLSTDTYCTGARNKIAISPQGDLYPCNMVQEKLGNILENTIGNILEKKQKSQTFKSFRNSSCIKCPTKFCKKCQAFTKRKKFGKIYCQYVKVVENEVLKRIKVAEDMGFTKLM